ncbi:hypothetical protein STXM2123_1142 [Streptomyces sp. F-3]|nr:hypothetical protein STXM2123_1142 [Streptomyces sp. F-3]
MPVDSLAPQGISSWRALSWEGAVGWGRQPSSPVPPAAQRGGTLLRPPEAGGTAPPSAPAGPPGPAGQPSPRAAPAAGGTPGTAPDAPSCSVHGGW